MLAVKFSAAKMKCLGFVFPATGAMRPVPPTTHKLEFRRHNCSC
jgi:hypothetical protein